MKEEEPMNAMRHPASEPRHTLDRPALLARLLAKEESRGLCVLHAPCGHGKSWLLDRLALALGRCTDTGQPARIWRLHGAVTLGQALRSFCRLFDIDAVPPSLDAESATDVALGALAASQAAATPLLIDLDGTPPPPAVLLLVGRIVLEAAAQRRVVLACRNGRALPLERLRGRVPVDVLRAAELALSADEIATVHHAGAEAAARWWATTQGWPVLCISTQGWQGAAAQVGLDAMLDHTVDAYADYMQHELLDPLPAADVQVLMQCAVFGVIEPGVLEAARLGAMWPRLMALVDTGLPVLEGESDWDRIVLHPVFRRFLKRRLRAHAPAMHHALHRRAAQYFAGTGHPREALRHAAATGDAVFEAQINEVCGGWRISWREGLNALDGAPSVEQPTRFPKAALARIYWQAQTGRIDAAATALAHLKQQPQADALRGDIVAVEAVIATYRDAPFDESWLDALAALREDSGEDEPLLLPSRDTVQAAMLNNAGLYDRAASAARASIIGAEAEKSAYVEFYGQLQYALALHGQGRVGEAAPVYGRTLQLTASLFGEPSPQHRMTRLLMAHAGWMAGRDALPDGADWIDDLYPLHAWFEPYARLLQLALAWSLQHGDNAQQDRVLQDFEDLAERRDMVRLRAAVQTARAQRETRRGQLAAAEQACDHGFALMAGAGLPAQARSSGARVLAPLWLEKVRIAIARLRFEDAGAALAAFRESLVHVRDGASALEGALFEACVALRGRRYRDASRWLTHSVDEAQRTGLRRPFLDNAELVHELVDYLRTHSISVEAPVLQRALEYTRRAATAATSAAAPARRRPLTGARLLLTDRETDILHCLSEGLSSKEIARRLTIAEGTVKTHRKHLYEKLDTGARSQALTRARELGLL